MGSRRVLVFSGHRIDAPDRDSGRFPNTAAAADEAAELIRAAICREKRLADGTPVVGFAGGASGGDIIFHEACEELGIPTTVMLALPQDLFAARSVDDAGPAWRARFDRICQTHPVRVLADGATDTYSNDVWQRANVWILRTALAIEADAHTLIALWDGKGGDGPGGTRQMIQAARARGADVVKLDANRLLHGVE
jgi:hypothetical protein